MKKEKGTDRVIIQTLNRRKNGKQTRSYRLAINWKTVERVKRKKRGEKLDWSEEEEWRKARGRGGVKSLSWKGRNNTTEAYSEIVGKDSNTSP